MRGFGAKGGELEPAEAAPHIRDMRSGSDIHGDDIPSDWDGEQALLPSVMRRNERLVQRRFWAKLRRFASYIPFAEDIVAAYFCAMDARTPLRVRGLLLGALAYFIMPLDMIPDFVVGLGFSDDATVLATVLALVVNHIRPRHRERAADVIYKMRAGN